MTFHIYKGESRDDDYYRNVSLEERGTYGTPLTKIGFRGKMNYEDRNSPLEKPKTIQQSGGVMKSLGRGRPCLCHGDRLRILRLYDQGAITLAEAAKLLGTSKSNACHAHRRYAQKGLLARAGKK